MRNSVILLPQLKICGVIGLMIVSLLFVGCEEMVNNQSNETVANELTQEILQETDDTENIVKTTWFNSEHQLTDIGLITVHQVDYTHSLLLLTDYETFTQKVNCNELFCGHDSKSCPAFISHGSSTDTGGFLYTS